VLLPGSLKRPFRSAERVAAAIEEAWKMHEHANHKLVGMWIAAAGFVGWA